MSISKTMRAVQLTAYKQPLEVREVPVPEPHGENVLVRIAGSGLCHSDLHLMEGEVPIIPSFPISLEEYAPLKYLYYLLSTLLEIIITYRKLLNYGFL